MEKQEFPILEFDEDGNALINPQDILEPLDIAPSCVLTFYQDVLDGLQLAKKTRKVSSIRTEMGEFPIYELDFQGKRVAVCNPGVGAPLACVSLEELIALGCRQFLVCGSGGVLKKDIMRGAVMVVESAVRQEGTSYHYIQPSREIDADEDVVKKITEVLQRHSIKYLQGKAWTTDAIFRETKELIDLRRDEGCLIVEMEASALLAVAEYRQVKLGIILGGGDDVSGERWDERYCSERSTHREKLFWLAVEAALEI